MVEGASVLVVCERMIGVDWLDGINRSAVGEREDAADNYV
jgi:hypothetical protein